MTAPAVPMWTDHLKTHKSKEVSPELDKAITEELKQKPSIMTEKTK